MAKGIKFVPYSGLSDDTTAFMESVFFELNKRGVMRAIDLAAMRTLAVSYELYLRATDRLLIEGSVVELNHKMQLNPYQEIATKNYTQFIKIMQEYGLTVKSRGNIKALTQKDVKEKVSPLDQFLKKQSKR